MSAQSTIFYCSRHHQKVQVVSMTLATGMRSITWSMVVTVVVESHLVPAVAAGNFDDTVQVACSFRSVIYKHF